MSYGDEKNIKRDKNWFVSMKEAQFIDDVQDATNDDTTQKLIEYESGKDVTDEQINNLIEQINSSQPEQIDQMMQPYMADENLDQDELKIQELENSGEINVTAPVPTEEDKNKPTDWLTSPNDIQNAVNSAIQEKNTLEIIYKVNGRRKQNLRLKKDLKLIKRRNKGIDRGSPGYVIVIHRIVEPYYLYTAGNGNLILVTYDRSIGRGFVGKRGKVDQYIRSFIVSQIEKCKVRDKKFNKIKGIKEPNQGAFAMKNILERLDKIAGSLETKNLIKTASVVKDSVNSLKNINIAQYVGVQGYWIRNRRCWDNCYRQKRTTNPKTPAQEVWTQCWDEYLEALKDDNSGWEKYASEETKSSNDKNAFKESAQSFLEGVKYNFEEEGFSLPESIYLTIESKSSENYVKLAEATNKLMEVASSLHESGYEEGEKLAEVCSDIMKEAGIWDNVKNLGGAALGWIGEKGRQLVGWLSQKINKVNNFIQRLQQIRVQVSSLLQKVNQQQKAYGTQPSLQQAKPCAPASTVFNLKKEAQVKANPLLREFNKIYSDITQTVTDLSMMAQQEKPQAPIMKYLNPAIENLNSFVQQADPFYASQQLDVPTMIKLLQQLNQVTLAAMRGLNQGVQEVEQEVQQQSQAQQPQQPQTQQPQLNNPQQPSSQVNQQAIDSLAKTDAKNIQAIVDFFTKGNGKTVLDYFSKNNIPFTQENIDAIIKTVQSSQPQPSPQPQNP